MSIAMLDYLKVVFVEDTHRPHLQHLRSMLPPLIEAKDTKGARKVGGNVGNSESWVFGNSCGEGCVLQRNIPQFSDSPGV